MCLGALKEIKWQREDLIVVVVVVVVFLSSYVLRLVWDRMLLLD